MNTLEDYKNYVAKNTARPFSQEEFQEKINEAWLRGGVAVYIPSRHFSSWDEMAKEMGKEFILEKMEVAAQNYVNYKSHVAYEEGFRAYEKALNSNPYMYNYIPSQYFKHD